MEKFKHINCPNCGSKNTVVGEGDDLSTTGPTGIYVWCKKCKHRNAVGYIGGTAMAGDFKNYNKRIYFKNKKC